MHLTMARKKSSASQRSNNSNNSDSTPRISGDHGPTPGVSPMATRPDNNRDENITVETVTSMQTTSEETTVSETSSTLGELTGIQTMEMFPSPERNLSFSSQPVMLQLLQDMKVMCLVTQRLATIGLVTPQHIVNAFGLQEARITQTFLQMGRDISVDKSTAVSCHTLVMFGHSQTIGTGVLCGPNVQWNTLEKGP